MSFTASVSALTAMTIISVVIGRCFRHVPAFLQSSLPIGEWLGAALLVYFGVTTLKVGLPRLSPVLLVTPAPTRPQLFQQFS